MAEWVWEGRTRTGEIRKGTINAESERDVHLRLRQQNIQPNKVKKKGKGVALKLPGMSSGKIRAEELVVFTRQLATMIDAGLPLVQCLEILGQLRSRTKLFQARFVTRREEQRGGRLRPSPTRSSETPSKYSTISS
jgi:type IV pilus assembly protein PilC